MEILLLVAEIVFFAGCFAVFQFYAASRARAELPELEGRWSHWAQAAAASQRLSRNELLRQLDSLIQNSPWRLMLKRLSVMAPLFGIVLTAVGILVFVFASTENNTAVPGMPQLSLNQLLKSLTPLYLGVLAGALLAIFNQCLLQWIDSCGHQLRQNCDVRVTAFRASPVNEALAEFETLIRSISDNARATLATAVTEAESRINQVANSISQSAAILNSISAEHTTYKESLRKAVADLRDSIKTATSQMASNVKALDGGVSALNKELSTATAALKGTGKYFESAGEQFEKSVKRFDPLVVSFGHRIQTLTEAATKFHESAAETLAQARGFGADIKALIEPALKQTSEKINSAATEMKSAATECLTGSKAISSAGTKVDVSATELATGSRKITNASDELARQLPEMSNQIKLLTESISKQEQVLCTTPEKLTELLESIAKRLEAFTQDRSEELAAQLQQGIRPSIERTARTLTTAADDCQRATAGLAQFVESAKTLSQAAASQDAALNNLPAEVANAISKVLRPRESGERQRPETDSGSSPRGRPVPQRNSRGFLGRTLGRWFS
jgi:hypothetical protein